MGKIMKKWNNFTARPLSKGTVHCPDLYAPCLFYYVLCGFLKHSTFDHHIDLRCLPRLCKKQLNKEAPIHLLKMRPVLFKTWLEHCSRSKDGLNI